MNDIVHQYNSQRKNEMQSNIFRQSACSIPQTHVNVLEIFAYFEDDINTNEPTMAKWEYMLLYQLHFSCPITANNFPSFYASSFK